MTKWGGREIGADSKATWERKARERLAAKKRRSNPSIDRAVQLAIQDATAILGRRPRMGRSR